MQTNSHILHAIHVASVIYVIKRTLLIFSVVGHYSGKS